MTISIFGKRIMTNAFEEAYQPTLWLKNRYFLNVPEEFHPTDKFDIDKVKGDRAVSVYTGAEAGSVKVDDKTFTTKTVEFPTIKEHTLTTAGQVINDRLPGENIYTPLSPRERSIRKLAADQKMLSDRADRAEEKQCSEILQTGVLSLVQPDKSVIKLDFGLLASHKKTLTGTDVWDNGASDPNEDLLTGFNKIKTDSGRIVKDVIGGSEAVSALINNTKIKGQFDIRRINSGEIQPGPLNGIGVRYIATLLRPLVDIWEYVELYDSPTSAKQIPFIDDKNVIMIGDGADLRQHYGPIHDIELINGVDVTTNFLVKRFFDTDFKKDPSSRKLMMQSRPIMAGHQMNAIYVLKVLA